MRAITPPPSPTPTPSPTRAQILADEITPKLEALRRQKADLKAYHAHKADVERTERFVTAHDYWQAATALEAGGRKAGELRRAAEAYAQKAAAEAARAEAIKGEVCGSSDSRPVSKPHVNAPAPPLRRHSSRP